MTLRVVPSRPLFFCPSQKSRWCDHPIITVISSFPPRCLHSPSGFCILPLLALPFSPRATLLPLAVFPSPCKQHRGGEIIPYQASLNTSKHYQNLIETLPGGIDNRSLQSTKKGLCTESGAQQAPTRKIISTQTSGTSYCNQRPGKGYPPRPSARKGPTVLRRRWRNLSFPAQANAFTYYGRSERRQRFRKEHRTSENP